MLTKRIIADILNVKHTMINDIKTFDDEADMVIEDHPSKRKQLQCPYCNKKSTFYDKGPGLRLWRSCD